MVNIKKFLIDLQRGAYLASSRHNPPELAKKSNFKLFITVLYLYYMSTLILLGGVLGPFHLDYLKAYLFTLVIPYFFYRLFLESLIIKRFDFVLPDTEKSERIKLYHYVLVGSFCSFVSALIIVFCLSTKST